MSSDPVIVQGAEVRVGVQKVEEGEGHTWTGVCSGPGCGVRGQGFGTSAWPTKAIAAKRIKQHLEEHRTGEPMQELEGFLKENGLERTGDGRTVREVALPEDAEDITDQKVGEDGDEGGES